MLYQPFLPSFLLVYEFALSSTAVQQYVCTLHSGEDLLCILTCYAFPQCAVVSSHS